MYLWLAYRQKGWLLIAPTPLHTDTMQTERVTVNCSYWVTWYFRLTPNLKILRFHFPSSVTVINTLAQDLGGARHAALHMILSGQWVQAKSSSLNLEMYSWRNNFREQQKRYPWSEPLAWCFVLFCWVAIFCPFGANVGTILGSTIIPKNPNMELECTLTRFYQGGPALAGRGPGKVLLLLVQILVQVWILYMKFLCLQAVSQTPENSHVMSQKLILSPPRKM